MLKRNSGKIITKININKKDVSIYFSDEKMTISHEAYTYMPLYVGKALSNKDIDKLEEITNTTKLLNYTLSLLKKSHYSEYRIREKLYAKEANKEQVDYIIKKLKNVDLIDDKAFIYDYLEYANTINIGKNKIIQNLENKGIFADKIATINFSDASEKRKASNQFERLKRKYDKHPFEKKKEHIYHQYLSLGFDSHIALEMVNKLNDKNDKDEYEKIKKEYEKCMRSLKNKYEGKELKDKIYKSLKNKGFHYKEILKIMEENGLC